jgi:hypothetical protein
MSRPTGVVKTLQPVGDPPPGGHNWKLEFDDEFNGTSIDTTKWTLFNNAADMQDAAECSESGGNLVLAVNSAGDGCNIASAWNPVTGKPTGAHAWELRVGDYVEWRAYYTPSPCYAAGTCPGDPVADWPTLWATGAVWPEDGEIDVAEGYGELGSTYHHCAGTISASCTATSDRTVNPTPDGKWVGSWHTYGVYRSATAYYVYWDGVLVATHTAHDAGGTQALRMSTSFRSGYAGNLVGNDLLLDYVRGWTK